MGYQKRKQNIFVALTAVTLFMVSFGYYLWTYDYRFGPTETPRIGCRVEVKTVRDQTIQGLGAFVTFTNEGHEKVKLVDIDARHPAPLFALELRYIADSDGKPETQILQPAASKFGEPKFDAARADFIPLFPGDSHTKMLHLSMLYTLRPGKYSITVKYQPKAFAPGVDDPEVSMTECAGVADFNYDWGVPEKPKTAPKAEAPLKEFP